MTLFLPGKMNNDSSPSTEIDLPNIRQRRAAIGENLDVLADIYDDGVNMAIWQRELPNSLLKATSKSLIGESKSQVSLTLDPADTREVLVNALGTQFESIALASDVAGLVDMFCYLFDLKKSVGLRLTALGHAMCPRFHVDRVPCRLATTYFGGATEWLPMTESIAASLGPEAKVYLMPSLGFFQKAMIFSSWRKGMSLS